MSAVDPGRPDVPRAAIEMVWRAPAVRPGVVPRTLLGIAQRRLPPSPAELSAAVLETWLSERRR